MALYDTVWYCNAGDQATTGHYAVAKRPQNTAVTAGQLVRQFTAPAVGSERVFVCIIAGTTANVTDATWTLTRGAKITDGTATWQECTGITAVNGDLTNTVNWTAAKAAGVPTLGAIIKRNSAASYQICSTAGTMAASEPSFSDTAGVTTNDGTSVWTCIGPVGNFTGGQAPFARLATALASLGQNHTIYVGNNHSESQATTISLSTTLGTGAIMGKVICHNLGSYPPASSNITTGAVVATTANVLINFVPTSPTYFYGITFRAAVGSSTGSGAFITFHSLSATNGYIYLDNCILEIATTTATASTINFGSNSGAGFTTILNNVQVKLGNTSHSMLFFNHIFTWQNTGPVLATGSSVPTSLIVVNNATSNCNIITLEALDLSQLTGNIIGFASTQTVGQFLVKDCKLHASTTFPTPNISGATVQLVRSSASNTPYVSSRYSNEGTETTETTITRIGGAADPAGQQQSRKIVTVAANINWLRPFKAEPYAVWNATTAANVTVTVCGTINSASLPNNDDIWLEIEYLGSASTTLGTVVTTTKSNLLASNAAVSSDASTWNGGGSGAGWSPFKLTTTLSSPQPGQAGYIHARVRAAKASATYYIDPLITLT